MAFDLLSLSRLMTSWVVGLIMEDGHMRKHLHRVCILREDRLCRMCDEQEETAEHLLFDCPAFSIRRRGPDRLFSAVCGTAEIIDLVRLMTELVYIIDCARLRLEGNRERDKGRTLEVVGGVIWWRDENSQWHLFKLITLYDRKTWSRMRGSDVTWRGMMREVSVTNSDWAWSWRTLSACLTLRNCTVLRWWNLTVTSLRDAPNSQYADNFLRLAMYSATDSQRQTVDQAEAVGRDHPNLRPGCENRLLSGSGGEECGGIDSERRQPGPADGSASPPTCESQRQRWQRELQRKARSQGAVYLLWAVWSL
ncbi:hypothetical protein J6590_099355 [Homalodisca vitripennis]|nr:hypothetical protein J6590_099355 [Homalodisca vitripennis]